jgi:PHD/YefM family antitoxin component YafN of YafNO toxin-antitoxin module
MNTQFITDNSGNKIAVIISIKEYEKMLADLEELEDIRLYDKVKASGEKSIPIENAFEMIENERQK